MVLRICIPIFDDAMLSREGLKFSGYAAPIFRELLPLFVKQFNNSIYLTANKYGDILNQSEVRYDGCIGELQQQRLDIAMSPTNFPLIAPNITNGRILSSSTTTIFSTYNSTFIGANTDVMQCFTAFRQSLWLLILFSVSILLTIQILNLRTRRNLESILRLAQSLFLSAALKQFSSLNISSSRSSVRLMLLIIAVFFFLINFFLTSMIKTEMVVQKAPDTISTYEEILQHPNCKPMWWKASSAHYEFANADPGSWAGKVWQRALKNGFENSFFDADLENIMKLIHELVMKETVVIMPGYFSGVVMSNQCAQTRAGSLFMDANMWSRTDPNAKEQLMNLALSSNVSQDTFRRVDRIMSGMQEHHLQPKVVQSLEFALAKDTGRSDVRDCMANQILYPEHELEAMVVTHYSGLWKFLAAGWCIALFVFMIEVTMHYAMSLCLSYFVITSRLFRP